jgi:hypothetical protein
MYGNSRAKYGLINSLLPRYDRFGASYGSTLKMLHQSHFSLIFLPGPTHDPPINRPLCFTPSFALPRPSLKLCLTLLPNSA